MDTVQRWMQEKGYHADPSPGYAAEMRWFNKPGKKSEMLRPTISRVIYEGMDALHNKTKFFIEGTFGPDPGPTKREVKWGNTVMDVLNWNEIEGIRVKLPKPYPTGFIQVLRETRVSNMVPMTEWTLPMTYTLNGQSTLKYVIQFTLKIRADMRGARYSPESAVTRHPCIFWHLDDSAATVTASGQWQKDPDTIITWRDGVNSKSYDSANPANSITFTGDINITTGKITGFNLTNNSTYKVYTNGGGSVTKTAWLDGYVFADPTKKVDIPFNPTTYVIPAGSKASNVPISNSDGVSATLTWGQANPVNPPTSQTQRIGQ